MDENTPIERAFRLTARQKSALKKLGLTTIRDLLYHFPSRHESIADERPISLLRAGDTATFHGIVENIKKTRAFRKKMVMTEAIVRDHTGSIKAIWFHQPYIAEKLKEGAPFRFSGKIGERKGKLYIANPEFEYSYHARGEKETALDNGQTAIYPVYSESRGITSKWFYHAIKKLLSEKAHEKIPDPLPEKILQTYHLPQLKTALVWIHNPQQESHSISARKRFAFEEVFFIQLDRQKARSEYKNNSSYEIGVSPDHIKTFTERFPFTFTDSQTRAIDTILNDFKQGEPMSRLLEGDVGSGKTAVAATTAHSVVTSRPSRQTFGNLQVAYMAPTEILANQHFQSFMEYFSHLPIQIGLITGSGCKKFPSKINPTEATDISRAQLLKWVASGEIPILIGTHALIQKTVTFKNLAYVIIDEQHRFGVNQRAALVRRWAKLVARGTTRGLNADSTQKEAIADNPADNFLYRDITYRIREAIFKVKREIGLGHKEVVYQKALAEEFKYAKLQYSQEHRIPILYRNKIVGTYIPDFVIEDKIIVELKALPRITSGELKQLWNYLKGSDFQLALLINFGFTTVDIKRVVYQSARGSYLTREQSASSPREVRVHSASVPHLLSMTATPIPRTLALTIFGDLDLTLLDEMPAGRKPVITEIISPDKRIAAYEEIAAQLKNGRQLYVICPRIDEPDPEKLLALNVKSVKAEAARLKKEIFPDYEVGILHSKLKPSEKEEMMKKFSDGKIDILVSTSVVEVGVNVPNATMIIIEGAERFGLAQLHQLRGRVLRSNEQAYCYIFAGNKNAKALKRLTAIKQAKSGFELAELDLKLRGGGELAGRRQWGISDIGMEAIKNIKMVEAARKEATDIIKNDPELAEHPLLNARLSKDGGAIHFE